MCNWHLPPFLEGVRNVHCLHWTLVWQFLATQKCTCDNRGDAVGKGFSELKELSVGDLERASTTFSLQDVRELGICCPESGLSTLYGPLLSTICPAETSTFRPSPCFSLPCLLGTGSGPSGSLLSLSSATHVPQTHFNQHNSSASGYFST